LLENLLYKGVDFDVQNVSKHLRAPLFPNILKVGSDTPDPVKQEKGMWEEKEKQGQTLKSYF